MTTDRGRWLHGHRATTVRSTNSSTPEINFGELGPPDQRSAEGRNALVPTKPLHAAGSIASDVSRSSRARTEHAGRIFFGQAIRDNLDIGRPDRVALIFNRQVRRTTPGCSAPGSSPTPSPRACISTTSTARIKRYHKEGKALRTETTINDTYDFAFGRRLTNLPALREIGFCANRRLLRVQRLSHDPADGADALAAITDPVTTGSGQRVLRPAVHRPRAQALAAPPCPGTAHESGAFQGRPRGLSTFRCNRLLLI
jgi:hypothetical protein